MADQSHLARTRSGVVSPAVKHPGPLGLCTVQGCDKYDDADYQPARAQNPEIDRNEGPTEAHLVTSGRWHPRGGKYDGLGFGHDGPIEECDDTACKVWVRTRVAGVGPDAPTETGENGASQSKVQYHFDSIDPRTLLALARVHAEGDAKYGRDNWRGIHPTSHINHAIIHLVAHLAGDRSDDHLAHALCRVGMAHAVREETYNAQE
jgi:Domain of unknown function (DUF5664)